MKRTRFPAGWDETRVRRLIQHYERQNDDEAVAEDETAFAASSQTVMKVPAALVPTVRQLIAKQGSRAQPNKSLQRTRRRVSHHGRPARSARR
jgi:hypothetical protein